MKPAVSTTILNGIATITLNRPEAHNAFDDRLVGDLTAELRRVAIDVKVRVVVIAANGDNFSAGDDLACIERTIDSGSDQPSDFERALDEMLTVLNELNKPTIARVQGAAYGSAIGLLACCDMAIAARDATFCFPQVRLGLVPSVTGSCVLAAIGERYARRYLLTAERFDASEAYRIGLVHDLVEPETLDATVNLLCAHLLHGGPRTLTTTKKFIAAAIHRQRNAASQDEPVLQIATAEAREGVAAYREKRPPAWVKKPRTARSKS